MEKRYRLEVIGITYNQIETGVYALILQQVGTTRRIPIIIGFPEAQAIECKLQEVATPRPLTHDLMASMLSAFNLSLKEVEIRHLPNGVFGAWIVLTDGETEKRLDARSSDAISLAIRVGAPIYTSETVLSEAGFDPDEKGDDRESSRNASGPTSARTSSSVSVSAPSQRRNKDLGRMSLEQLSEAMQFAAENENYEEAARIKTEIDRRTSNNDQA